MDHEVKGEIVVSTRDIAFSIFQQLSEDELKGFIALFRKAYPPKNDNMAERRAAFERMKRVCRSIPGLDEEKELAEYREEKYGDEDTD